MKKNYRYIMAVAVVAAVFLWWLNSGQTWKTAKEFNLQVELKLLRDGSFESHEHELAESKPFGDLYESGTWSATGDGIDLTVTGARSVLFGNSTSLKVGQSQRHLPIRDGRLYWNEAVYLEKA